MKKKVLITGANGQVGKALVEKQTQFPNLTLSGFDRRSLDITKKKSVQSLFLEKEFDFCINTAAYTAVDLAESEAQQARLVNINGVKYLAEACREHQVKFIHLSTDYVYHLDQNRPYVETDPTNPQGVYAQTKLEGEQAAMQVNPNTIIIRTSWVYSPYGKNFVLTMIRLGKERANLNIVFDQIGTPTYAPDLAGAILQMVLHPTIDAAAGIFNYSNEGVSSWYDFAYHIFELTGLKCTATPIESKDYPTPASRPSFSVMNKGKIKETFGLEIPHWQTSLKRCLKEIGTLQR